MAVTTPDRTPAGVPTGGQFASRQRGESGVTLADQSILPASEAFGDHPSVPDADFQAVLDAL